jgi:hypothetical protein
VQNLLLGLGVLLLAVAAVIFVAVSWGQLGVAGRAAVMLGVTGLAAAATALTRRRGLVSTAEWLSGLTVALALLDAFALRRAGIADVDAVPGSSYWAGALTVVAVGAALGSCLVPTRVLRLSAAVLGQLPIPIVTLGRAGIPDPLGFGAQTILVLLAVVLLRPLAAARDARLVLSACVPLWWLCASVAAVDAGYPDGSAELLGLAGIAATAAWLVRGQPAARGVAAGATAAAALAAALVAVDEALPAAWLPAAAAGLALAGLGALFALGRQWRPGPVAVCAAVAVLASAAVLEALLVAVAGPLTWLVEPWSGSIGGGARELLVAGSGDEPVWVGGPEIPVALLAAAAVPVLAVRLLAGSWLPRSAVAALTAPAMVVLPPALDLPYPLAVGWDLAGGAGLTCGGLVAIRRARAAGTQHVSAVLAGAVLVGVALAWSLAVAGVTVGALGAGLLVAMAAAWLAPEPVRAVPAALAVGLACAETAAWTRWLGGTVADTGLAVAVVAAAVAAIGVIAAQGGLDRLLDRSAGRRGLDGPPGRAAAAVAAAAAAGYLTGLVLAYPQAGGFVLGVGAGLIAALAVCGLVRPRYGDGIAAALACVQAAALARWIWADPPTVAFAVAVAAAALGALAAWLAQIQRAPDAVLVCAAGYTVGTVALIDDPDRLWLALLAGGVAAAAVAVRPAYRRAAWVSAPLLVASSWVRLALSGVTAPEAYTVPAGLVLLAVGVLRWRDEEEVRSWPAFGPGLGLVLLPSLIASVTDPGLARPLLLGLAALAVLLAGVTRRLAAPLVLGGLTLAVDVLAQLAPTLAAVYSATPRWVAFAAAGLLLVVLGATYENRLRDVRRLQRELGRMH